MSNPDAVNHFNEQGDAHMVDVGTKAVTTRVALAAGEILMADSTLERIASGRMGKGDVLGVARIAAIQATKRTWELIPLAHPLLLTGVEVELTPASDPARIVCRAEVRCVGQTGIEMEALTAVSVGLLTIYDMCKAIDRGMLLQNIGLLRKEGGKTGLWERIPASCPPVR
ncbi:MAG: cyclic pyranopterin monophosphate synthase MoaC [Acidithiobacillus ferrooxidans]|jgi:cyclic pyranopterin phosphate synthase|uniref:cyclic pyranopterin monophosphate synthase MoaC n=1 Tax=Acidithiobacillus ferrooxidans TaxID=920 RepID=UPI0013CF9489|nr:cyclic pyranopterin monophosphate synthase MoaC [Acidithiobacillus ferrooxidans]MCL4527640.1 cyclic pyranopterin monophosphate synthase MoaC [Gammaproteobacteria bacterium]MBU2858813.1 cyclic pyranopterin monophosphate synthase MoaC [Acidithiobacillus ferrooxidans]MBU2859676.1 cyclic pyranopterin monophosphate synthase MoaC [Acidithiobacillus ferrooxidans]MCL5956191.1 cyclic pyranopterin monophosphate synthase MoaC [Gammaproteobacteria bacterium]MCR2830327.1 cyclic pyranopterin monophosphat